MYSCGEAPRKMLACVVCLLAHATVVPNTQPTPMENIAASAPTPSCVNAEPTTARQTTRILHNTRPISCHLDSLPRSSGKRLRGDWSLKKRAAGLALCAVAPFAVALAVVSFDLAA